MMKVTLSSEEILRGLKHYRRIAKQDLLRAPESPSPDAFTKHAEARREVYGTLAEHGYPRNCREIIVSFNLILVQYFWIVPEFL